jgi:hypothetical protein
MFCCALKCFGSTFLAPVMGGNTNVSLRQGCSEGETLPYGQGRFGRTREVWNTRMLGTSSFRVLIMWGSGSKRADSLVMTTSWSREVVGSMTMERSIDGILKFIEVYEVMILLKASASRVILTFSFLCLLSFSYNTVFQYSCSNPAYARIS